MMFGRRFFVFAAAIALIAACASQPVTPPPSTVVYLVRHAEKQPGDDPGLTAEGQARAAALSARLSDAGLVAIYATDTRRARETAAPAAEAAGLAVTLYDPRAPEAFTARLLAQPGAALVVGHSNTTPDLVALLGGEPGRLIDEATEFDRFYTVRVTDAGVSTLQETYGAD